MKRIALSIILPVFLSISCYFDTTSDTSRVVMAVAAPPSAGVARLHVAVFAGLAIPETLILKQTFEPGSLMVLLVPTGSYRVFLIWAENASGEASHYGVSLPMNLKGEDTNKVPMDLYPINDYPATGNTFFNVNNEFKFYPDTATARWSAIPGAKAYELKVKSPNGGPESVYGTMANYYREASMTGKNAWVRASSSVFGIPTIWSNPVAFP